MFPMRTKPWRQKPYGHKIVRPEVCRDLISFPDRENPMCRNKASVRMCGDSQKPNSTLLATQGTFVRKRSNTAPWQPKILLGSVELHSTPTWSVWTMAWMLNKIQITKSQTHENKLWETDGPNPLRTRNANPDGDVRSNARGSSCQSICAPCRFASRPWVGNMAIWVEAPGCGSLAVWKDIYIYLYTHMYAYIYIYRHTFLHTFCMHANIHTYIHTYITYIHYLHTLHTLHTYIHTYIYTYIHTYVHIKFWIIYEWSYTDSKAHVYIHAHRFYASCVS